MTPLLLWRCIYYCVLLDMLEYRGLEHNIFSCILLYGKILIGFLLRVFDEVFYICVAGCAVTESVCA